MSDRTHSDSVADVPHITLPLPGPNAQRIIADDARYISPSYTRSYPLVAKRGRGAVVEDVDGNRFLDFSAGIAVVSTGHCHPAVVAAIQKQAAELIHMSGTDFYYEQLNDLAKRLSAIAPMSGPHKFYYGNSGAEAVECAIKLARYHTRRQHLIAFYGAFHGRTMGALSLTASNPRQRRRFSPLVPGVTHVPYPDVYHGSTGGPEQQEAFALGCARFLEEKVFRSAVAPEEVAAIILEPIQGEGGYVVAPDEFSARDSRDLRPARDFDGGGRGAIGHGPHRNVVGHSTFRRGARHRYFGQRYCIGNAAERLYEQGGHHGLAARFARLHVRRQSRVYCGRARHVGRA